MQARANRLRVNWVDYAKGICIFAVVCLYSANYTEDLLGDSGFIQYWVDFARPFRMPDFFLLSGLFLARVINRPWPQYLDKKVIHYGYFFALWTFINLGLSFSLGIIQGGVKTFIQEMWFNLSSWPFKMLWFIQMLPLYFLFTRFIAPAPKWLVLIIAAGLQAFPLWETGRAFADEFFNRYLFFYLGYIGAPFFFKYADWIKASLAKSLAVLLVWIIINQTLVMNDYADLPIIGGVLGVAGAMGIIALAAILCQFRSMSWLSYLGEHSIVVYLAFYWPMRFAGELLVGYFDFSAYQGWFALLITAIGITGSILIYWLTRDHGLTAWLFKRPAWLTFNTTGKGFKFAPSANKDTASNMALKLSAEPATELPVAVDDKRTQNSKQKAELKSNDLKSSIVKVDCLEQIEKDWNRLNKANPSSYFLSWSWIGAWSKLVKQQAELYLFRCEHQGQVVAMCFFTPYTMKRRKGFIHSKQLHFNELVSDDFELATQYNGLVVSPGFQELAWHELFKVLNTINLPWDEALIRSAPLGELRRISKQIPAGYKVIIDYKNTIWRVAIDNDCCDLNKLLTRFKSRSRNQLKRSVKEISFTFGEIKVERAKDIKVAQNYLAEMATYHTKRWQRVGKKGTFSKINWSLFHNQLINNSFAKGEVLLFKITAGSQVLGYIYGHWHGDTALLQQTGFMLSTNNKIRPGYVSHLYCMMACAQLGIRFYDFLPDDGRSYKRFFCDSGGSVFTLRIQKRRLRFAVENGLKQLVAFWRARKKAIGSKQTA